MGTSEWIITLLPSVSAVLFGIGGGGFKWARRFVMPVVLCAGALLLGIVWWRCLIALLLTCGAATLGYGESHPLWRKALTILALGLCLLPLANGANALLTLLIPAVFGAGYWLSRKYNWFTWRLVELSCGFAMGGVVVLLALTS